MSTLEVDSRRKRHPLEIIAVILTATNKPLIQSHVMLKTGLMNQATLNKYILPLVAKGHIEQTADSRYVRTEKGKEFLTEITVLLGKLQELMS